MRSAKRYSSLISQFFLVENKLTCSSELIDLILDIVDQILERKKIN